MDSGYPTIPINVSQSSSKKKAGTGLKNQFARDGFDSSEGEACKGTAVRQFKQNLVPRLLAESMS